MDRLKFRCITDTGIYHAPSDSFSVSFHDTGISLIIWSSDGIVDEVDVNSVDQFTGLQDKNGKDIYEGDIIKMKWIKSEYRGVVRFRNGSFCLKGPKFDILTNLSGVYCACSEIIGNIHENPELMEA